MKRTYYLLLLLCLPLLTAAAKPPGYLALQPGDWFEMQVTFGPKDGPYPVLPSPYLPEGFGPAKGTTSFLCSRRYTVKYLLLQQLANGNQQYRISLERAANFAQPALSQNGNRYLPTGWMGYDSYYPSYIQGLTQKPPKDVFTLEITSQGKTVSLLEDSLLQPVTITMTSYGPATNAASSMLITTPAISIVDLQENIQHVMALRTREKLPPLLTPVSMGGYSQLLVGASYLPGGNTLVKGSTGTGAKEITLQLSDSTYTIPVKANGEFICPLLLKGPQEGMLLLDNRNVPVFLTPGDTLAITFDKTGAMTLDGNAASNSRLSEAVNGLYYYRDRVKAIQLMANIQECMDIQQIATDKFNALLRQHQGDASPVCLDYYQTAWKYYIAGEQLLFLNVRGYQADRALASFQQIPVSVTTTIDTLPVALCPYPQNNFYKIYIEQLLQYQTAHISYASGGKAMFNNFYDDFFSAVSILKGYPLYYRLASSINKELMQKSWTENQRLKPYYQDFIQNCDDSKLTTPVVKNWQLMDQWAPGNKLPFSKLSQPDGQAITLPISQDKITCLLFDDGSPIQDTAFLSFLKRHPEVHFIYLWMQEPHTTAPQRRDSLFRTLAHVTSIEIANKGDQNYAAYGLAKIGNNNFVVLDKWGRIANDHIHSTYNSWPELEEAFKAAEKIPRFSAAQKASFLNIAGWSLGSILLTALAGIWIYRVRVRRLQQGATLKATIRDLEIKAIRSQMNPHFIFNALNSIQSLINTGQFKAANSYLVKFSQLLRSVLHNAEKNTLPLSDELATIQLYCELEQLRFNFNFEMTVDPDIEPDLLSIPGMIIQPLVENAIVHGIAAKGAAGILQIKTTRQDNVLRISIYDNGTGFTAAPTDPAQHNGIGLKLVRERLQLFTTHAGNLQFSNGTGTTALLTIPIEPA
ncbi:sensor histidine kinase [Chitinophaga eiseniae]|uniref:Histidine kinase n=1 Tax=Chitinophaga eiseniae TaxID=634771 RepID=A0A847SX74_9BACT|nr:histidine kinase [Chitinophaga eiseniae]NLR81942.1 histidine kinase [Chitinophaga eiseniae]